MNPIIKPRILVTGGTGFLGQYVTDQLKNDFDLDILSRSGNSNLTGHLGKWNAGLDLEKIKSKKYKILLHMAGLYDLKASPLELWKNNIMGTNMALSLTQHLDIPNFINTSSVAAVTNLSMAEVSPYDLDPSRTFHDSYGESKALTETQIMNWQDGATLKVNLRLGILTGESQSGKIQRIDGPYLTAGVFKKLRNLIESWPGPLPLPGNPEVRLPFVPVDIAAGAVVRFCHWALKTKVTGYKSFHIVPEEGVSVLSFYKSVLDFLKIKYSRPFLVPYIHPSLGAMALGFPEEQLRYALSLPLYHSRETVKILGPNWCPEFQSLQSTFWEGYEKFISNR